MKFLADECCDGELVNELRADGHDVVFVPETMMGSKDEEILSYAYQESRILITEDKDFGQLVYRLKLPTHGIILIRISSEDNIQKIKQFREAIMMYGDRMFGQFVILETSKIRVRNLIEKDVS